MLALLCGQTFETEVEENKQTEPPERPATIPEEVIPQPVANAAAGQERSAVIWDELLPSSFIKKRKMVSNWLSKNPLWGRAKQSKKVSAPDCLQFLAGAFLSIWEDW